MDGKVTPIIKDGRIIGFDMGGLPMSEAYPQLQNIVNTMFRRDSESLRLLKTKQYPTLK